MLHSWPGRTGGWLAGRHRILLIRRERGYSEPGETASGGVRRIILRQRLAEPEARVCALVASDGMGGTVPSEDEGGAVVPGSG